MVQKLQQALKTSSSGTNTSSQMLTPFTGMSFINDCLPQPTLRFSHLLLQSLTIRWHHGSFSEHRCIVF